MPTILLKKSDTASAVPGTANLTNLAGGAEVAVNTADKRMFTMNSSSAVVELGTNPSSLTCADASFTVARVGSLTVSSLSLANVTITSATVTTLTATSANIATLSGTTLTISGNSFLATSSGNVGVGTTSPVAKLAVQDSTAPKIALQVGAAEKAFLNYTQSTFVTRLDSDGPLSFASNNTEAVYLTSSQDVGVGTQTPDDKLSVAGNIGAAQTGNAGFKFYSAAPGSNALEWFLYNSTSSSNALQLSYYNSGVFGGTVLTANKSGDIGIGTASPTNKLTVDGNANVTGNVGIGTASPAQKLDVNGVARVFTEIRVKNTVGNVSYLTFEENATSTSYTFISGDARTSGYIGFWTNNTERMRLDSSGNLGIGTTSPTAKLHIYEATAAATRVRVLANGGQQAALQLAGNGATFGTTSFDVFQDGGSDAYVANRANASLQFWTNNTERARISSTGNVVVNTAAVATTATDGFLYIPTCAGAPTGVPTTFTGRSPLVVDSTNNRFYVYVNGAWKYAVLI